VKFSGLLGRHGCIPLGSSSVDNAHASPSTRRACTWDITSLLASLARIYKVFVLYFDTPTRQSCSDALSGYSRCTVKCSSSSGVSDSRATTWDGWSHCWALARIYKLIVLYFDTLTRQSYRALVSGDSRGTVTCSSSSGAWDPTDRLRQSEIHQVQVQSCVLCD
jgi:hypothetical protein